MRQTVNAARAPVICHGFARFDFLGSDLYRPLEFRLGNNATVNQRINDQFSELIALGISLSGSINVLLVRLMSSIRRRGL